MSNQNTPKATATWLTVRSGTKEHAHIWYCSFCGRVVSWPISMTEDGVLRAYPSCPFCKRRMIPNDD